MCIPLPHFPLRRQIQVLQDGWTGRLNTENMKRNVVEYLTTHEHLKKCVGLATEHAKESRKTTKGILRQEVHE